ncbi:tRNA 2-selenouridine(34) synthase MnmH [Halomicronema hongdechloris]|nr:tRNA 2-selenouridine(34) synthase MnmH [Halomicronema hongdechloris]
MSKALAIDAFLAAPGPILDVRSPGEYGHGHIPGAIEFSLFSDEERAQVGICYKQQGRSAAVELGFAIAGPKFADFIARARILAPDQQLRLHCWRGGMRSGGMAWVLEMAGFQVITLEGGYKAFRRWVRRVLAQPRQLLVLGGMTGTAKTDTLLALAAQGAQVVDLEGLAHHRGSSYGGLGMPPQPSTEHFENLIAWQWATLSPHHPVWIEAESRRIGTCRVPDQLFRQMQAAPLLEVRRSLPERLNSLVRLYGDADPQALIAATERIRKRLGGQRTQDAIKLIRQGALKEAFAILLTYYDRAYQYDLDRRQQTITPLDVVGLSPAEVAHRLRQRAKGLPGHGLAATTLVP